MRILLDLQGVQRAGRSSGVGRHILALGLALARDRGGHEIVVALDGRLPDAIGALRASFDGLLPQTDIRTWRVPDPPTEGDPAGAWQREVAVRICGAFLASLRPDLLLASGLPCGFDDDPVATASLRLPDLRIAALATAAGLAAAAAPKPHGKPNRRLAFLERADLCLAVPPLTPGELRSLPGLRDKAALLGSGAGSNAAEADAQAFLGALRDLAAPARRGASPDRPGRRRLAYLSPLPPARSGIAEYSVELLAALRNHYDIELVAPDGKPSLPTAVGEFPVRSAEWFGRHAHCYDRVLYHLGNSLLNGTMFQLLDRVPGVVVLHDFFLGHYYAEREFNECQPGAWTAALYASHGYRAVRERFHEHDLGRVVFEYPCSTGVLTRSLGTILHSDHAVGLMRRWHGAAGNLPVATVPMLRTPPDRIDRAAARRRLGIAEDDFLFCSIGHLGATKLSLRILESWLNSAASRDAKCRLAFVGHDPGSPYNRRVWALARADPRNGRVAVTGWVEMPVYLDYLAAADVAIQLRARSRGETSAAALDCLNHGLPTIVNAHGAFAELPADAVWMLPDSFTDGELAEALDELWRDRARRLALGARARERIRAAHSPAAAAAQYAAHIERCYAARAVDLDALVRSIAAVADSPDDEACRSIARSIAESIPRPRLARQLLLDVSETSRTRLQTGIERVARALAVALLEAPPAGYRVEPVYLSSVGGRWHYRYAREFALRLLECPTDALPDEPVEPGNGDILLGLDFSGEKLVDASAAGLLRHYRNLGVAAYFLVYDLLPIQAPAFFPPGKDRLHEQWLAAVAALDGAFCISRTVADELAAWLRSVGAGAPPFRVGWFRLGADLRNSAPSRGLPDDAEARLADIVARPTFLMVGTVEPRKGHLQAVEAFVELWRRGIDVNLAIVGREGWTELPDDMRRAIPDIVARLRGHAEFGRRLLWLEAASDEYLERIYAASSCLIAAAEGEGFGLPMVEAAVHGLPVIARDIPVFREVGQSGAVYFTGTEPTALAAAVAHWLRAPATGPDRRRNRIAWRSWQESAAELVSAVIGRNADSADPADRRGTPPEGPARGAEPAAAGPVDDGRRVSVIGSGAAGTGVPKPN